MHFTGVHLLGSGDGGVPWRSTVSLCAHTVACSIYYSLYLLLLYTKACQTTNSDVAITSLADSGWAANYGHVIDYMY